MVLTKTINSKKLRNFGDIFGGVRSAGFTNVGALFDRNVRSRALTSLLCHFLLFSNVLTRVSVQTLLTELRILNSICDPTRRRVIQGRIDPRGWGVLTPENM